MRVEKIIDELLEIIATLEDEIERLNDIIGGMSDGY